MKNKLEVAIQETMLIPMSVTLTISLLFPISSSV